MKKEPLFPLIPTPAACCLLLILLAVVTAPAANAQPAQGDAGRILVVHSYHETQAGHVVEMTEGIQAALEGSGAAVRYFHMDTKRRNNASWKSKAAEQAMALLSTYDPSVVITMDDNAQEWFARHYASKPGAPDFVFGGVNHDPARYGFPAENVTGVIERPNVKESIELLVRIVPKVRRILLLSDDSPTTAPFCEYVAKLNLPVAVVDCLRISTFDQWKETIAAYRDRVDAFGVYVIRTIRRSETDPLQVPEAELAAFLADNAPLPSVGFFDSAARAGLLCGVSVSMREQGHAAGTIARKLLLTESRPADFPVSPTENGRILLNLQTAEKLGFSIRYDTIRRANEVIR